MSRLRGSRRPRRAPCALAVLLLALAAPAAAAGDTYDWYRGAEGYRAAMDLAAAGMRPLVLYVHVDGSEDCRRFQDRYLDRRDVHDALGEHLRVELDPEKEAAAGAVAREHGIRSYPDFRMIMPGVDKPWRLNPFRVPGREQAPEEFIAELKRAAVGLYLLKGSALLGTDDWPRALHIYSSLLRSDPRNADAHAGLGQYYRRAFASRGGAELLQKAEDEFRAALEIVPDHAVAREELSRLRQFRGR